ncbi:hypothetical protein GBA65_04195 [Rubrobacter marinus]|uniref:Uncharacterized protein n=1 Tax=Rubrobacter marinus TaxID=2653852 RepID=A0A6G8PUK4_9ACTN|nr:hypothetical protein [Rubrobacter marinus]QIN77852.1 hypothetical protein GBA65_04195 [Rubrobacter marinus]
MNVSGGGKGDGPDTSSPGEGFELYRHRNAEATRARGWHGLYWARRTAEGGYELRSVPSSLGEPSAAGGVMPGEGFERLYERVDPGEYLPPGG